jgi:uncharacterized membrane protein YgcG
MEWLLIALVAGGSVWAGRRFQARRTARREAGAELEGVRRLADEDVTLLGEELQRLDAEVADRPLDEQGRVDYQRALDAYESAQRSVGRIRSADEVSKVTDTLSTGRYALACVRARVAGLPVPVLRVPCFFNPQHGPSVRDVHYTAPGRGTRTVPACAQDAARIADGELPEVRKVKIGARMVPYWQAGAAYLPYGQGYFLGSATMIGAAPGWAFTPDVSGFGFSGDHLSGFGGDGGGGFDGGGFDGGGGGGD